MRDAGGVLLSWAFLVVAEFVVIGVTCRGLFAGNWELVLGRKLVAPIAVAMLAPAALVVVAVGHLASRSESLRRRSLLAGLAAVAAATVGVGITGGRHFARLPVRAAFVALLAVAAYAATAALAPRCVRLLAGPRRRAIALLGGVLGAALFWLIDARVLPRLYPAAHDAALAACLAFAALTVLAWRSPRRERVPPGELVASAVGLGLAVAACAWAPFAARRLERSDNLRFVLDQHAPILGRAVHFAAWLAPSRAADDSHDEAADLAGASGAAPGEVPRALDWSGDDILLVTVDALRADHLGAYGYARSTTPNLDALAKRSALFEHAYCPTPHTSYSITSMMTGKAMRPLLSLGLGQGAQASDTWATYLRRYGYKTAAFYPPAVFYIDEARFGELEESGLGFEYRWVEFTSAEAKVKEVLRYLTSAGPEPLFLWVHLFEPHEPYVVHAGYEQHGGEERSDPAIDAYDSEVAYADAAVGGLLRAAQASADTRGRKLTVLVTADHGEEFGEHGGRYHGTTCYEEQVRVPLLIAGPGVVPRRVRTVVQTIDLLPTVLSALGVPRPARLQGRDLGRTLAEGSGDGGGETDPGLAYAETDDQTLVARGDDRLICARKLGACALYDLARDPAERVDRTVAQPALARELRATTARIEREQGRYEASEVAWPDALRRGLQGEVDAAEDVAALLDDASVLVRRKAAEVTFRLAVAGVAPQVKRAFAREEDDDVRRWEALALVRTRSAGSGEAPSASTDNAAALLRDPDPRWRRAAALAFALRGDPRGKAELADWWREAAPSAARGPRGEEGARLDAADAKQLLQAIARIKDADAVPPLLESLDYVPLRPAIAEALGQIGDPRAKPALLAAFSTERYETARPAEARALLALLAPAGAAAGKALLPALTLFAGLPDPMAEAVSIAREGSLLDARSGGAAFDPPGVDVETEVSVPEGAASLRVWVLAAGGDREAVDVVTGRVGGEALGALTKAGAARWADVRDGRPRDGKRHDVSVQLHGARGIRAVWVVPVVSELPPFLAAHAPESPDAG